MNSNAGLVDIVSQVDNIIDAIFTGSIAVSIEVTVRIIRARVDGKTYFIDLLVRRWRSLRTTDRRNIGCATLSELVVIGGERA